MSTVAAEVSTSGQAALAALLSHWPVECVVTGEQLVSDAGERLTFAALVLVTAGPVWVRFPGLVSEQLETGDLLIAHEVDATTLTASIPDDLTAASPSAWLSDDPLQSRTIVLVRLDRIGGESSPPLMPKQFVVRGDRQFDPEGALRSALLGAVRSQVATPVANCAATALYLQCIHRHLQSRPQEIQLLGGLFDAEIGPIVSALIEAPARDWTVESLAEVGGMSRSAFARKFRDLMGAAPIDFLVEVRMWQAARQLKQQTLDLKSIARQAGYQSPAAFSVAFKRWSGTTPSDYRRGT